MIKLFSSAIILLLLLPIDRSFAQEGYVSTKVYSGYLHHYTELSEFPFFYALSESKSPKKDDVFLNKPCSIEFRSSVSFLHQPVVFIPHQLSYFIRVKDDAHFAKDNPNKEKDVFDKPIIKIYTHDGKEYSIDPYSEGKQVGITDEHHISDAYLIYLILGSDISHLEIVNMPGDNQNSQYDENDEENQNDQDSHDKYVLDKLEIHGNH